MPGLPPRQHKHERQYTHSVVPTRQIWNDDYVGQMIFEDLVGLKLSDICLTGEEKSRKNLTQVTCPDRGSNPSPLRDRRACYRLLHNGGRVIVRSKFFKIDKTFQDKTKLMSYITKTVHLNPVYLGYSFVQLTVLR